MSIFHLIAVSIVQLMTKERHERTAHNPVSFPKVSDAIVVFGDVFFASAETLLSIFAMLIKRAGLILFPKQLLACLYHLSRKHKKHSDGDQEEKNRQERVSVQQHLCRFGITRQTTTSASALSRILAMSFGMVRVTSSTTEGASTTGSCVGSEAASSAYSRNFRNSLIM